MDTDTIAAMAGALDGASNGGLAIATPTGSTRWSRREPVVAWRIDCADLVRHLRDAETKGLDLDCRIGPGLAGPRGVWLWLFGGRFFAFELTDQQCRQLEMRPKTMKIGVLRPLFQPEPDHLPGVIKDVRFDREPLIAGERITPMLTWTAGRDARPWAATLDLVNPAGDREQYWAYPPPGADSCRALPLAFGPLGKGSGAEARPYAGPTPAFFAVWYVPDTTSAWNRVPLTPPVGRLLDLRPASEEGGGSAASL